ncbi:MAG: DNA-3-methyladenine glycosylase, partial [Armatimonadota bacterium]|nr:DNA-3-methyladenine glycosylase [Armatimonadota bacterium]
LNLVTAPEGVAEAVLIRAVEPVKGIDLMRQRRPCGKDQLLTSGPARLCQAFGIDLSLNKTDAVAGDSLSVEEGPSPAGPIGTRTRIGISNTVAAAYPWRFVEVGNPYLSRR